MAMWDGSFTPAKTEWVWEEKRVWWLGLQCERSHKFLFLKKAYRGRLYVDWTFKTEIWLSKEEFLFSRLRGDFDETSS